MRPILLKIAGLHSYRELVEIDFVTLCEAGLFGIFGPTGSGKSTILDAITLALYGQVVRMGGNSHPQQVLNQHEQRLFVSFTFELGKAAQQQRYTIEREFGLDKKGNKRPPEVRLIQHASTDEEADTVLESKASSATSAVEKLIGLTLQDFTRAVVLPQGQFSKFLTLKGSERNEMLQRIFQLQEYGEKLNERIRCAYEQNRAEQYRLQLELAALGEAGPEALKAAAEELAAASEHEQRYAAEKATLFAQKQEMEQVRQLQLEQQQIRAKLDNLAARQAEMSRLTSRITEIEASVQAWPHIAKARQLRQQWQQTGEALALKRTEKERADQAHEQLESRFHALQAEQRSAEPALIERKSKLEQALEWERELAVLQSELEQGEALLLTKNAQLANITEQWTHAGQQLSAWEQERTKLEQELQGSAVSADERKRILQARESKQAWERERAKWQQSEREVLETEAEERRTSQELEQLHAVWRQAAAEREGLQQQLVQAETEPVADEQVLASQREQLSQAKALGRDWREADNAEREWLGKWQALEPLWTSGQERIQQLLEQQQAEAEDYRLRQAEKAQAEADWHAWQQENMVRVLRDSLHAGEACPVCGSTTHPHTAEAAHLQADGLTSEALQEQVKAAEVRVAQAEERLRQTSERLQQAREEAAGLAQRKALLQDERNALTARVDAIREECSQLGSSWSVTRFAELLEHYKQAEVRYNEQAKQRETHVQRLGQLQQAVGQLRERELEQKLQYERKLVVKEQIQAKLVSASERLQEARLNAERAETELRQVSQGMPPEQIELQYNRLEAADKRAELLQKKRQELDGQIARQRTDWQTKQEQHHALTYEIATLRERNQERQALYGQKRLLWNERTNGERAASCIQQVEQQLQALRTATAAAEQAYTASLANKQQLRDELSRLEEAHDQLTRLKLEAETAHDQAIAESGLASEEHIERCYTEREQVKTYREQVRLFQAEWDKYQYEQQRIAERLADRSVTEDEYAALCQVWSELEATLQTTKDQVAVARRALTLIEQNHEKWLALNERLELITDEQSRYDDMKKLFEGKAFVQFIAEEKLASIARDASYHLKRMTKDRYALELGDDGEFVLRDEGAGGIRRSVSTLSGGETFLTSLALALALSVEIQMRGARLEFFFLDEGFGTLDPELLEVVLNALERLRMSDFTIGIISHVPELRVRMPRRLVVTPAEPLGRGSQVELELD